MKPKVTLFPVTSITMDALRFCDSPFLRLGPVLMEFQRPGEKPQIEDVVGASERCGKELSARQDEMYKTAFILCTPPDRLSGLISGPSEAFEAEATRFKDSLTDEQMRGLILICFDWFGRGYSKPNRQKGRNE